MQADFLFWTYFYFIFILFDNSVRNMRSDFNFFYLQSGLRLKIFLKKNSPTILLLWLVKNDAFALFFFFQ